MNELQLHDRLSALADDLTPGDDPFELVAGARALHRRRRRARLGVAGAALAVALVAVGVPTAVNTLSAPDRGHVAGPGADDPSSTRFGDASDALLEALPARDLEAVPDPEDELPCPDGAAALSAAAGRVLVASELNDGLKAWTGCSWSDETPRSGAAEKRLDVQLLAAPDMTLDEVARWLEPDAQESGCGARSLLDDPTVMALIFCDADTGTTWDVVVFDEDGHGAWRLIAAAGPAVPGDLTVGARSVGALWGLVSPSTAADTRAAQAEDMAARIAASSPELNLTASTDGLACPDASELVRYGATLQPDGAATAEAGCMWVTGADLAPGTTPVMASLRYFADALPPVRAILCPSAPIPGSSPAAVVEWTCAAEASGAWTVTVPNPDGGGGWVFSITGDPEDPSNGEATLFELLPALVQAADETW